MDTTACVPDDAGMSSRPRQKPALLTPFHIGEWIYALGETPAKVSKATGLNEGYLSELISGRKRNPSQEYLLKIADYLGISIRNLYEKPPSEEVIRQAAALDPMVLARLRARKSTTEH